jgi:hypothetical protein
MPPGAVDGRMLLLAIATAPVKDAKTNAGLRKPW